MINIVLDYDGTIHDSIIIYKKGFIKAVNYLEKKGCLQDYVINDKDIKKFIGYNAKDMWENFLPKLPKKEKKYCSNLIGETMNKEIEKGNCKLYNNALKILEMLKKERYQLIFLSNCKISYMNSHIKTFKLDKYFNKFYPCEKYDFISKKDIFNKYIYNKHEQFIIIGDRKSDIEIDEYENSYSIACDYGYGSKDELKKAKFHIKDINEIPIIINKIRDSLK